MIHIRDFVVFLASDPRFGLSGGPALTANEPSARLSLDTPLSAARILRPVLYAPPSMPALDLLLKMQASRTHMALVIDEYGGTDGLVSIEDVVESIVGDIEDEHDEAEAPELHASPATAHSSWRPGRLSTTFPRRWASILPRSRTPRRSTRSAVS